MRRDRTHAEDLVDLALLAAPHVLALGTIGLIAYATFRDGRRGGTSSACRSRPEPTGPIPPGPYGASAGPTRRRRDDG